MSSDTAAAQAANELAIKVKSMRATLTPGAAAILDEVISLAADSKKGSKGGRIFLTFSFKLVAVKTIS